MPVVNDRDHGLDLETLLIIHGYYDDPQWATEGIAEDLGLTLAETRQVIQQLQQKENT